MLEEKQKLTTAEAMSAQDQHDKSIDELDLNKTGEISKLSNKEKEDTNRKSKDKSPVDPPVDASVEGLGKSAMSSALSSSNQVQT